MLPSYLGVGRDTGGALEPVDDHPQKEPYGPETAMAADGAYGEGSRLRATRRVAIMPPDRIRTLPFGTALILLRSARPIVTALRPWTKRRVSPRAHRCK